MTEAARYRAKAAEALADAKRIDGTNQPERTAALLHMADTYTRLAESAEREDVHA